jgi:hypothetical protein
MGGFAMIRRPDKRSAAVAWATRWIVGSLLLLLGCVGGSGSSGFDLAENGAIMEALDGDRCVENDGLTICPANPEPTATPTETTTPQPEPTVSTPAQETPTPTPENHMRSPTAPVNQTPTDETRTPTPTGPTDNPSPTASKTFTFTPSPTPTPTLSAPVEMRIDTSLVPDRGVDCELSGGGCTFELDFAPQGFPPDIGFQVAARLRDPDGEWLIFAVHDVSIHPTMPVFRAVVTLPLDGRGEEDLVAQVAVLVFATPPINASPAVDSLGASGANFAFVTSELLVSLGR